jgi:hypothetical protein
MDLLEWWIGMMKSMDLTVGDALYLYTICSILPDSSDFLPYKEFLSLWLCIEPPRHAWRRPAIQQDMAKVAGAKMEVVSRAVGHTPYLFQLDFLRIL